LAIHLTGTLIFDLERRIKLIRVHVTAILFWNWYLQSGPVFVFSSKDSTNVRWSIRRTLYA
jgi:hypothetical protein